MDNVNVANKLQPMAFPLYGARLIEASAGTGKTFTIVSLYLRLLLGHGSDQTRHAKPLDVDEILVVTFTEAATAELRDRIRTGIKDAYVSFCRGKSTGSYKQTIDTLLQEIPDHHIAKQILLDAERRMDEAAIYTIHGFCQRMLTQNAFESGSRFNNEFVTDESQLKSLVVADYWRRNFYHLPFGLANEVRQLWSSPAALLRELGSSLTGAPLKLSVPPMSDTLDTLHQENMQRIDSVKALWREHEADLEALIANSGINKRSYTKKSLPAWLAQVSAWAAKPTQDYSLPDKLDRFHQQTLIEKTAKGEPPEHPVFVAIAELLDSPANLHDPLLAHAIEQCRSLLAQAKARKGWLSFDDLLTQLSAAIDNDSDDLLAGRIRTQYPVAMIDEFQDTDPLQYSIFSTIYRDHADCGLFMIGDPKQAIYAFRGADIFTYIQARRQVTDHYTLDTNWRSTAEMVGAVNAVFARPESPFIYDQDIQFTAVNHSPKASERRWRLDNQDQPALTFWLQDNDDGKPITKGSYQETMAAATAAQIQHILTQSQQQSAYFCDGEQRHMIEAGDIAVLVRTGSEGKLVKKALAEQGIASVYLSNRDSVFASAEAGDIQRLLQAVLTPEDERALRAALASSLFALTAVELDELNNSESAWEVAINSFKGYRKLWLSRGVMPMLRTVMAQNKIAERLLADEGGERRLTDLLHIGELLQAASQTLDSDYGLLRWLAENVAEPNGNADDQILRLESERNLVQIVTIHKSKGLEYDLVFMPFVCSYREVDSRVEVKYHDQDDHSTVLDIAKQEKAIALAEQERLAEDLRLIYVALTRAVYGCFVGMAPIRNGRSTKEPTGLHRSAIGHLVQDGKEGTVGELTLALAKLADEQASVAVVAPPVLPESPWQPVEAVIPELAPSMFTASLERNWWMTSYSSLVKQGHQAHHDSSMDLPGFDIESAAEAVAGSEGDLEALEPARSIYTFPRGARPGTFLHTVFEEIEFTAPVDGEATTAILTDLLQKEHYDLEWLPVLQQLIHNVLHCELDGKGMRLVDKTPAQRLTEMEFLLPIELLQSSMLNKVIAKHDPVSAKAGELGFATVSGMLKGFIDLVFEHEGKYYVLDWKSNHLGDDPAVYRGEQLVAAMRDHRYDLQYQIYALALQRFLRSRIPDYDYERHFGGVYYLFLRGMEASGDSGIFHARPTAELLASLEQLIDGEPVDA